MGFDTIKINLVCENCGKLFPPHSQVFPGMVPHLLTLQEMFFIPLFRELWSATQACAATKAGMEYLLTRPGGQVVILVPGGAPESLNCDKGEVRLILKEKKGFIKLALRCGADLVPAFTFGENTIYDKVRLYYCYILYNTTYLATQPYWLPC